MLMAMSNAEKWLIVAHQVWAFFVNGRRAPSPAFLKNGRRALTLDRDSKIEFYRSLLWTFLKNLRLFD